MKNNSIYIALKIWLTIVLALFCDNIFSQGFKVVDFKQNLNDGSAFHAPQDADGHLCGLIKIRTDNSDLQFKGSIIGDVENKMNEYWVYVPQSCQFLNICHPNYLPLIVPFSNYSIEISSKATYILTLEETKFNKEKTGITIIVKPENADLYVDDVYVDNLSNNGFYQLYLPKGEHFIKLSKTGYHPNVQAVQTGKASQTLNVELESVMAELEVRCKTATAELYIDDELKGNGSWKGEILAGEHKIEARQQNFNNHIQTVTLAEKESRTVAIPELKRSMGKLRIVTEPSNLPVIVDGKTIGTSPCTIDIESGKHYVSCKTYGCITNRSDVEVISGEIKNATLKMKYEDSYFKEDYENAYQGDLNSILSLVCEAGRKNDYEQAFYWIDRHPQKDYLISNWYSYWKNKDEKGEDTPYGTWLVNWIELYCLVGNPEKALELFPILKADEESAGGLFSSDLEMMYIGEGFYKKKEYDKAIECFLKAGDLGYEGLGDCYVAKGNKHLAASYYRKCLSLDYYDGKNRVEKKLKELGL